MPDRGCLALATIPLPTAAGGPPPPWRLPAARWAQITFEVARHAALEEMPVDTTRPVPCYARLFVLDASDSPAGPFRLAALLVGARYKMLPRNVLVEGVIDGPVDAVQSAFGARFVSGSVLLEREGPVARATIARESLLATLTLPELRAIEPNMLRWDPWLGFADSDGVAKLAEFGPRPEIDVAFLSKHATLDPAPDLPRSDPWRRLRNINTVSACYAEGALSLTTPEIQPDLTAI